MIRFNDAAKIGGTKKTQEGYLVATSSFARTGVQTYLDSELGDVADGFEPDAVVRVYRAEDQVFHKDTLASITRVPVTLDHPPELVDADNWATYSVGDVGDAFARDGEWIVVNPMIKDAAARTAAETTHKEISMGYTANIVKARDGVDADFEMVDIRMNHLALVPKGRAGSQARIGDAATWGASPVTVEDDKMTVELKTVILGDATVEVKASDAATVAAILKDHKTAIDAKDTEIGELRAKLATAEAKVLDESAIAKLVDAKVDAKTKRDAVAAKFGDEAVKDASDAEIAGMFKVIDAAGDADETVRNALKDAKPIQDAEDKIKAAQMKFLKPEGK